MLAQQSVEGEYTTFAIVVGTKRHIYIFKGGLKGECPDDAGQCAQNGIFVDSFSCVEDCLHHIEW